MSGVAAILLAAGRSRRMGRCKQLLPLDGTTVIGRCLENLSAGGVGRIVTVVSPEGGGVAEEARRHRAEVVVNSDPEGDMASSVRAGRDALPADAAWVVIALGDYPLVQVETVRALLAAGRAAPGMIIVPVHAGRRGHPILLPRRIMDELLPESTLRDLIKRDPARLRTVAVDDPGVLIDMDTPEAYAEVCRLAAGAGGNPAVVSHI